MKGIRLVAGFFYIGIAIHTASLQAQVRHSTQVVHSINAVGYINVVLHPGLNLVGFQLDPTDHSIASLFPDMPEGTTIYRNGEGAFTTNVYQNGQWERPEETVAVGDGVFILNPDSQDKTVTFVGEVLQGDLTNSIPRGLSIRCSMVPQAGKLSQVLGLRLSPFDEVFVLSNGALKVFTYLPDGTWKPSEPNLRVAESFLIDAAEPLDWVRHFEVNIFGLELEQ